MKITFIGAGTDAEVIEVPLILRGEQGPAGKDAEFPAGNGVLHQANGVQSFSQVKWNDILDTYATPSPATDAIPYFFGANTGGNDFTARGFYRVSESPLSAGNIGNAGGVIPRYAGGFLLSSSVLNPTPDYRPNPAIVYSDVESGAVPQVNAIPKRNARGNLSGATAGVGAEYATATQVAATAIPEAVSNGLMQFDKNGVKFAGHVTSAFSYAPAESWDNLEDVFNTPVPAVPVGYRVKNGTDVVADITAIYALISPLLFDHMDFSAFGHGGIPSYDEYGSIGATSVSRLVSLPLNSTDIDTYAVPFATLKEYAVAKSAVSAFGAELIAGDLTAARNAILPRQMWQSEAEAGTSGVSLQVSPARLRQAANAAIKARVGDLSPLPADASIDEVIAAYNNLISALKS